MVGQRDWGNRRTETGAWFGGMPGRSINRSGFQAVPPPPDDYALDKAFALRAADDVLCRKLRVEAYP